MATLEPARAWVVDAGGRFAGNACIYSMDLTLPAAPGAALPRARMAGVSAVGVHPTHRRRGLLRRLMAEMLSDARPAASRWPDCSHLNRSSMAVSVSGTQPVPRRWPSTTIDLPTSSPPPTSNLRLLEEDEAAKSSRKCSTRFATRGAGEPNRVPGVWEESPRGPGQPAARRRRAVRGGLRRRVRPSIGPTTRACTRHAIPSSSKSCGP